MANSWSNLEEATAAWVASDTFVLSTVLIGLSILALWAFPGLSCSEVLETGVAAVSFRRSQLSPSSPSAGVLGTVRAVRAYQMYTALAQPEIDAMERAFAKLNREQRRIATNLRYPEKIKRLRQVTAVNAKLTSTIARIAKDDIATRLPWLSMSSASTKVDSSDLARVRECLKHFVRDWSYAGASERATTFNPIFEVLKKVPEELRSRTRVLVPGAGLGRLAWEISELGFDTTANEYSAFMCDAWRLLLDERSTFRVEQHLIHPYAHWWSHQRSTESLFRAVTFPDVIPRLGERLRLVEGDFLTLPSPQGEENSDTQSGFDVIVTHFFIDTSPNIVATLQQIHNLLISSKGMWINVGPLLWPTNPQPALELSLEEVLDLSECIGLDIQKNKEGFRSQTVECQYTRDEGGMMRWTYLAEFWVAQARET